MTGRWDPAQWHQVLMMLRFQLMLLERTPMDSDDLERKRLLQDLHKDVLVQLQELLQMKGTDLWEAI